MALGVAVILAENILKLWVNLFNKSLNIPTGMAHELAVY